VNKAVGGILIVAAIVGIWNHATEVPADARSTGKPRRPAAPPSTAPAMDVEREDFRCDGRVYCSEMTSCAEARYFLDHCPGVKMDGEGDGNPCERQWCKQP
jgi:hypothetical protein